MYIKRRIKFRLHNFHKMVDFFYLVHEIRYNERILFHIEIETECERKLLK